MRVPSVAVVALALAVVVGMAVVAASLMTPAAQEATPNLPQWIHTYDTNGNIVIFRVEDVSLMLSADEGVSVFVDAPGMASVMEFHLSAEDAGKLCAILQCRPLAE